MISSKMNGGSRMQILKEDIKNRIIAAALEEFKEQGYLGASIRNIASNAGIALGTIYKYFKNKEDLFNSLVEPVYKDVLLTLKDSIDSSINPICTVIDIKDVILDIFKVKNKELLILFDKSKGSKFENFKEEMISVIHIILQKELMQQLKERDIEVKDPFICYVLSTTLLEGVYTLLRTQEDGVRISILVDQLIHIIFTDIEKRFEEMSHIF